MSDEKTQRPGVRAFGPPPLRGTLRTEPDDFEVTELLGFEPTDEGPHALLFVQKRGLNTLDMIAELSAACGLKPRDVGYCGLKDRHAVTRQWLSVPAERVRDPLALEGEAWTVLSERRNRRKLRLGAHRGNAFAIRVRDVDGELRAFDAHLAHVAATGVPNYFGPQRFGRGGDNLRHAQRLFVDDARLGRRQRRFALSAARSWRFNRVVSERVAQGSWAQLLPGEPVSLDGSRSFFQRRAGDEAEVAGRLAALDVHPSGPLWGAGDSPASGECARIETQALAALGWVREGLARAGLKQERRALRLRVNGLRCAHNDDTLTLEFELGRGAFATSVVHELVAVSGGEVIA